MKVSVIISNYNYGKYIAEAIESVLAQTYQNFELIIVDDGSIDYSKDVIDQYYNNYPSIIKPVYKENGGQGSAFNAGYKIATGEVIAFLDSDDYWYENKLQRAVQYHLDGYDIVEHSLNINNEACRWVKNKDEAQKLIEEHGIFSSFGETSSLSFKRSILDKVFPIPEEQLKICSETYVIYAALHYTPKIKTLNEVLTFYRVHGNNHWYNNMNRDENHFRKFIYLINGKLIANGEKPYNFGKYKFFKACKDMNLTRENKFIIYGLGDAGQDIKEALCHKDMEIKCFMDSNINKRDISNKIYHYSDIPNIFNESTDYIIVASQFTSEILTNIKLFTNSNRIIPLY